MKELSKRGQNKREIILEAAVKVFSSKGYHNTRMEEIASVAGIGKGTIYEYFKSKLELFQEMLLSSLDFYYDNMYAGRDEVSMSFEERINTIFTAHFDFCRGQKDIIRVLFWDVDVFGEELKDWAYKKRKEKEERLVFLIEESVRKGELRDVNPRLLTEIIMGSLATLWVPIVLENWDVEPEMLAHEVVDILMNGARAGYTREV